MVLRIPSGKNKRLPAGGGSFISPRFSVAPCARDRAWHAMGSRTLGMSGRSGAEVLLTIEEPERAGKNAAI